MSAIADQRDVSVEDYYASADVHARLLEYCGGTSTKPPTAAYVVALDHNGSSTPSWDGATRVPAHEINAVWARRPDLARSLWDSEHLLFFLELDYQNIDAPAEAFVHPADVFFKLEAAYQAASRVFRSLRLPMRAVVTGRGYHFLGQIPLDDPLIEPLALIVPYTPAWYAGVEARRPAGVMAGMSERQARAATGLGCLVEYAAHLILESAAGSDVPLVFNGTVVGRTALAGRECVSVDFSHVGDPLDVRHIRVAFGTYQWHRLRPDIFGPETARSIPPTAALPRGRQSLMTLLTHGRGLDAASRTACRTHVRVPNIARGLRTLLSSYELSALGTFHRAFYADLQAPTLSAPTLDLAALPPCVSAALIRPNDLLLKPEYLQHVVRGLMSRGWTPAQIARHVQSVYEADHGWGDRWVARMDVRTRAEFEVRVFAGLIATGTDALVDFNCVSAQEKDICPRVGCQYDLRIDRDYLASRQT
jgi:hypothetical protein